jgi:hypothetical protein
MIRKDYDRAISIFESIFDRFTNTPQAMLPGTEPLRTNDRQLELWYG